MARAFAIEFPSHIKRKQHSRLFCFTRSYSSEDSYNRKQQRTVNVEVPQLTQMWVGFLFYCSDREGGPFIERGPGLQPRKA